MTPQEVLAAVKEALERGNGAYALSPHCRKQMKARGFLAGDITRALTGATNATVDDEIPGRWRISGGTDTEEEPLTVVIEIHSNGHIEIITPLK